MPSLSPGANSALPEGEVVNLRLATRQAHADLIVLCVRADGTADGDNGVALWSQPACAAGAVTIDTASDTVTVQLARLPGDVQRVLVVAQADGVADLAQAGALTADVAVDGRPAVSLSIAAPPPMPTVQVGEVYRHGASWKVRCLGDGYAEGLQRLLETHGIEVTDGPDQTASRPVDETASRPVETASRPDQTPSQPVAARAAPIDLEKRRRIDIVKRVQATGSLSLLKKVEAAAISLDKQGLSGQRAQVVLVLDVSGSARPLFRNGRYQVLIERALAAGLLFDDDGTIQTYLFDRRLHEAPDITLKNFESWAGEIATRKNLWGGTKYAPPIQHLASQVGRGATLPTYAMFITDGGNSDRAETAAAMKVAAGTAVFWQFMAVGREDQFPFLQRLDDLRDREVDNADFFAVENPAEVGDAEFSAMMMQEFPGWLAAARSRGIVKPA